MLMRIFLKSLLKEKATPTIISKNLAELKANKVSLKILKIPYWERIV